MKNPDDESDVEVVISRYSGEEEEITITLTTPRTETEPKKKVYITMTPHDFAMALTGRGGMKGRMCQFTFDKVTKKPK